MALIVFVKARQAEECKKSLNLTQTAFCDNNIYKEATLEYFKITFINHVYVMFQFIALKGSQGTIVQAKDKDSLSPFSGENIYYDVEGRCCISKMFCY